MKNICLNVVVWILAMLFSVDAAAQNFREAGIYYTINNAEKKTVSVTNGYFKYSGHVIISDVVDYEGVTYRITEIAKGAFRDCPDLVSVAINKGIVSIGDNAFSGCSSLTAISIPDRVESLGDSAFCDCVSLPKIVIPSSVTKIGDAAFDNCSSLVEIFCYAMRPPSCRSISSGLDASACTLYIPIGSLYDYYNSAGWAGFDTIVEGWGTETGCFIMDEICYKVINQEKRLANVLKGTSKYKGTVVIPDEVICKGMSFKIVGIDTHAFYQHEGLTSVVIGDNVTMISFCAFQNCKSLTSVTFGKNVSSIYGHAFGDCDSLTSVVIPESVTYLGNSVFGNCDSLHYVCIGDGVESIPDAAFMSCSSLDSVTIGESVTSISDNAFSFCESLKKVRCRATKPPVFDRGRFVADESCTLFVPTGTAESYRKSDGWNSFCNIIEDPQVGIGRFSIDGIYYRVTSQGKRTACVEKNNAHTGSLVIPPEVTYSGITFGVNALEDRAFYRCTTLDSITIPSSITSIEDEMFYACPLLKSVTIQGKLTKIGKEAFGNCTSLESVVIPQGVGYIGSRAFSDCYNLESIFCPQEVDSIHSSAFMYCYKLSSLPNLDALTKISSYTFYECRSLTSFSIPSGVGLIDNSAFAGCSSLRYVTIPDKTTSIGVLAFDDCSSLESYFVSDGNPAFSTIDGILYNKDQTELWSYPASKTDKTYVFPSSVTSVKSYAFCGNTSLKSITIPHKVVSMGGAVFAGCSSLDSVVISYNVKGIYNSTFAGCSSLSYVEMGPSVKEIDSYAFFYCTSLRSITIPRSVSLIKKMAFENCYWLEEIHCLAIIPPVCEEGAFMEVDKASCVLYVPTGTADYYRASDEWKDFLYIVEEKPLGVENVEANTLQWRVEPGGIVLDNLSAGVSVSVYDMSGRIVYESFSDGAFMRIPLPKGGIYMVKAADCVVKVAL